MKGMIGYKSVVWEDVGATKPLGPESILYRPTVYNLCIIWSEFTVVLVTRDLGIVHF